MTDEEQLGQLEHDWMAAWQRQDRAALEALLAPDYTFTLSTNPSRTYSREEWLGQAMGGYRCRSFMFEQLSVRVLEPYAVVASRYRQEATVKGVDRSHEFFFVDVWRRAGTTWRVVARHSGWPEPASEETRRLGDRAPGATPHN